MYVLQFQLSVASRFMNVFELSSFHLDFSMLKHHQLAPIIGNSRQNSADTDCQQITDNRPK